MHCKLIQYKISYGRQIRVLLSFWYPWALEIQISDFRFLQRDATSVIYTERVWVKNQTLLSESKARKEYLYNLYNSEMDKLRKYGKAQK